MSKEVVRRRFVEHARTMVFIAWEPHGDLPGRVQKPLFFKSALRRGSHRHLEEDLSGLFEIWVSFGGPWGIHFQTKIMFFFGSDFSLIFGSLLGHFWEGPAAGAGPV